MSVVTNHITPWESYKLSAVYEEASYYSPLFAFEGSCQLWEALWQQ